LYFHTAIRILLSSSSTEDEINYANKCLKYFSYKLCYFFKLCVIRSRFPTESENFSLDEQFKYLPKQGISWQYDSARKYLTKCNKNVSDSGRMKRNKIIWFEHPFISDSTSFSPNIKVF
jgi:hypothetical protein